MNIYRKYGIALLAGAVLLAGFAGNALAWQSAACSTISNLASLTYSVGGVDQTNGGLNPLLSNSATFTVDTLVDLMVDVVATPVSATGANQVLAFTITNLGNDTQQYQLQLYEGLDGTDDIFDMNNVRVYVDADNDGILDLPGDTPLATDIGGTGPAFGANLGLTGDVLGAVGANDNALVVFVVSDVPAGQGSTNTAAYSLKAITHQSVANGGGVTITGLYGSGTETVANNSCGNPVVVGDDDDDLAPSSKTSYGGVADEAGNASAYDSGVYTVVAAGVSVTKAVFDVIWDPINGAAPDAQAIPGAYVQYTITVSNAAGGASATLTQITDTLVSQLAIDPDLISSAGPGNAENSPPHAASGEGFKVTHVSARTLTTPLYYSTANDADGVEHNAGTITATFADLLPAEAGYADGELKAGESVTLTFNVIIQ